MYYFILQTGPKYLKETDSKSVTIAIILFAFFFILLSLGSKSSGSTARSRAQSRKPSKSNNKPRYSKNAFKKKARSVGLSKIHINTLYFLIAKYNVQNPFSLLDNRNTLDNVLSKILFEIDISADSENAKEAKKLSLFRIKQIIENNSHKKHNIKNTKQLQLNQSVVISTEPSKRYQSKIVSNLVGGIGFEIPKDNFGNQLKWKKWTPLTVYFWTKGGEGYSFKTKVVGYNNLKGQSILFLQHSNEIELAQQRKSRRRNLDRSAYFYPVEIVESGVGKRKRKRAIINDKLRNIGTVIDVSSGGLSLKSSNPFKESSLIKIEFETEGYKKVIVFGKVVRIRFTKPVGGIMHIKFTSISRVNLNKINTYVYDFERN